METIRDEKHSCDVTPWDDVGSWLTSHSETIFRKTSSLLTVKRSQCPTYSTRKTRFVIDACRREHRNVKDIDFSRS